MSSVTRTRRFCVYVGACMILVQCVLDYIMHNDDMQASHMYHDRVHNPRRARMYLVHMIAYMHHTSRRDRMCSLVRMCSRNRSRRTCSRRDCV